jgi:hypothetical protein
MFRNHGTGTYLSTTRKTTRGNSAVGYPVGAEDSTAEH